jgi:hypothetical protein
MARPQSHHNHSLVSQLPQANRSDSRTRLPRGIVGEVGEQVPGEVKHFREENNWHLYTSAMARHGVRMRISKVLLLSVRGIENTNRQVGLGELGKDAAEDGLAEKKERELQVC